MHTNHSPETVESPVVMNVPAPLLDDEFDGYDILQAFHAGCDAERKLCPADNE